MHACIVEYVYTCSLSVSSRVPSAVLEWLVSASVSLQGHVAFNSNGDRVAHPTMVSQFRVVDGEGGEGGRVRGEGEWGAEGE